MSEYTPKILELKGVDPETAFMDAQREARHLYGNSGTTGTIADADGCVIVSGPALLHWDCRRVAQQMLREGHAQPGGPAFLLRLADPARTKQVKVTVDVTGMHPGQADDAIDAALRDRLPNEQWGIHSVDLRFADAEGEDRKGVTRAKTVVSAGTGKKVTKYVVKSAVNGQRFNEFDTLAEAKAAMKTWLDAEAGPLQCIAEVNREEGPLLAGERKILKKTVVATGTIGTTAPGGSSNYLAAGVFPIPA